MLRCAQHDKSGKRGCCTWHDKVGMANLTLLSLSFARKGMFWRKPKQGEVARSSKHFFVIPSIFFCHSKCSFLSFRTPVRNPQHGCFAALSMTEPKASFRTPVRNPQHGCFAALSMTEPKASFRTPVRNPQHGCFAALSMTNRGSVDAALGMTR